MTTKLAADFLAERVCSPDEVKARHGLSDHAAWQPVLYTKQRGQIERVRRVPALRRPN